MRIRLIIILLFYGIYGQAQPEIQKKEQTIRLMSYNISNCKGKDGVTDYQRIGAFIRAMKPDVIALQELDSATIRSGGRYVLSEVAKHASMHYYYAPAITYQGGKYGLGILCKDIPLRWYQIALPGKDEARTALIAEFENYFFCCTHFSMLEEDRIEATRIIMEQFNRSKKSVFVAGDLNAKPEDRVMREWRKQYNYSIPIDKMSCLSVQPPLRIDYILHYFPDNIKGYIRDGGVIDIRHFDHSPLWIDVSISLL